MRRYRAIWTIPGHYRSRSRSGDSIASIMEHAQKTIEAGDAFVVTVFPRDPKGPVMYEVHEHVTRIHWPRAGR